MLCISRSLIDYAMRYKNATVLTYFPPGVAVTDTVRFRCADSPPCTAVLEASPRWRTTFCPACWRCAKRLKKRGSTRSPWTSIRPRWRSNTLPPIVCTFWPGTGRRRRIGRTSPPWNGPIVCRWPSPKSPPYSTPWYRYDTITYVVFSISIISRILSLWKIIFLTTKYHTTAILVKTNFLTNQKVGIEKSSYQ